jgi:hypothetical protein
VSRAAIALMLLGCGGRPERSAGEHCVSSSECGPGLICDFGQPTSVCAEVGSNRPAIDATPGPPDAAPPPDAAAAR